MKKIATNSCSYFQGRGPELPRHCSNLFDKKPTEAVPLPHKLHANIKTGRITGGGGEKAGGGAGVQGTGGGIKMDRGSYHPINKL